MSDADTRAAVAKLYDAYPFPPEPLLDEPPPGYNWRWVWDAAYNFCTQQRPARSNVRILDAGCGSGVGTEYLAHLNPDASVLGIDISPGTLDVARERCQRSGANNVEFRCLPLEAAAELPGKFELINCVGVLHHLPNPVRGIQALAPKLAPGGILHVFVYAEYGRWEIRLMQQAIALLQSNRSDYREGVKLGRALFAALPETNRLVRRERERWSLENQRDANFADMYVHPQEIDYTTETLFELIAASGLEFVGFSNPQVWQPERLLGSNPDLLARARALPEHDRYRLIEQLDPEGITHFEFFLARSPLSRADWSDDAALLAAIPLRHPCLQGWESRSVFDLNYQLVDLNAAEFAFLKTCDGTRSVGEVLAAVPNFDLAGTRSLQTRQLLTLSPTTHDPN
ncbi:methyltransferase domain protein [Rubidibacter lacunae KORDI 51-2]|uniref:Methyltransferase domain protein n=1 Tax=Rubidibacter lacunae KORDI 51-2 TaxID=582515 RepID=U5DGD0_9CHRO|nr:class I SAM-dependent methyltransferase [Rubidibacter lacunae]ERN40641.1 methyltransferase domain protein [Rubidibacter lacunae KORDI 51-2]